MSLGGYFDGGEIDPPEPDYPRCPLHSDQYDGECERCFEEERPTYADDDERDERALAAE